MHLKRNAWEMKKEKARSGQIISEEAKGWRRKTRLCVCAEGMVAIYRLTLNGTNITSKVSRVRWLRRAGIRK